MKVQRLVAAAVLAALPLIAAARDLSLAEAERLLGERNRELIEIGRAHV